MSILLSVFLGFGLSRVASTHASHILRCVWDRCDFIFLNLCPPIWYQRWGWLRQDAHCWGSLKDTWDLSYSTTRRAETVAHLYSFIFKFGPSVFRVDSVGLPAHIYKAESVKEEFRLSLATGSNCFELLRVHSALVLSEASSYSLSSLSSLLRSTALLLLAFLSLTFLQTDNFCMK